MRLDRVDEFAIAAQSFAHIQALLQAAFDRYPASRPYFKLRPHFRYLAWDDATLAGHMGIDHRVIRVGTEALSIFGVIDFCVAPTYQRQGLATHMLKQVEEFAHETRRDAIVLFADDHRLYSANGYERIDTLCTWMKVDEHHTRGIAEQSLGDCMMAKCITVPHWPTGAVDMLGYLF